MNGGVIYFSNINNEENIKEIHESIIIENNIFKENNANNNGGAMNLEFNKLNIEKYNNNSITNNVAGAFGGGVYLSNYNTNENISFSMFNNPHFENNLAGSYADDYSARPSFLYLLNDTMENGIIKVKVGDYISLLFILKDIFNKKIMDKPNYYSVIKLRLLLFNKYSNSKTNNNYRLLGNACNFIDGIKIIAFFKFYY